MLVAILVLTALSAFFSLEAMLLARKAVNLALRNGKD